MGLFGRKTPAAKSAQAPAKTHAYKAPDAPASSGHIACQICGLAPDDFMHDAAKTDTDTDTDMHWA
jgi:hypothetical protein